jgi:hypothetical protein
MGINAHLPIRYLAANAIAKLTMMIRIGEKITIRLFTRKDELKEVMAGALTNASCYLYYI